MVACTYEKHPGVFVTTSGRDDVAVWVAITVASAVVVDSTSQSYTVDPGVHSRSRRNRRERECSIKRAGFSA
jgi:hypothetical protein